MSLFQCLLWITLLSAISRASITPDFDLTNIADDLLATIPGKCLLHKDAAIENETVFPKKTDLIKAENVIDVDTNVTGHAINITCHIDADERPWNWTTFQEVTNSLAETHSGFSIELVIICSQGGSVVMKRPHEARLLRSLSILGCVIRSYDVLNPRMIITPNSDLEKITLENCVLFIRLSEILEEIKKQHEPDCFVNPRLVYYRQYNLTGSHSVDVRLTINDSTLLKQYQKRNCLCPNLQYLELSGHAVPEGENYISLFFPVRSSQPLFPNLTALVLTGNKMKSVPYQLYADKWWTLFGALEKLDLSGNSITSLPFRNRQPEQTNPFLFVNMNSNAIESITEDEIRDLTVFWPNSVSLANNPIVCNCSMYEVASFLKVTAKEDNPWKFIYGRLGNSIECAYPANLTGVTLLDLTNYAMCDNELGYTKEFEKYIALICGVVIGHFLIIALVLRYRKKSRFATDRRVSYQSPSKSLDNKMYDAFISYSSLDETWVMGHLYKFLESKEFHVCLHHKDFIPGACISENIINSIEKSRHTVLVLSPNFLCSEWCLLEFRKAFQQTLADKNGHLIVVVKESVDLVSLENDMRHFIQTYTYLPLSDSHFWEKLNRSLT
ncbi:toll-like receptor 2 [Pecten maximus]|uniref:toll-like receptor 2 n=1 Tax=Pecten maximus TaxID=6579 RepID=UPI0014587093|nr:toll-like receptor 2 [Pecten maximus]